jgi:hypothetical protein
MAKSEIILSISLMSIYGNDSNLLYFKTQAKKIIRKKYAKK